MLTINTSGSASRTGDYGTSGTGGRNEKAERLRRLPSQSFNTGRYAYLEVTVRDDF